MPNHSSMQPLSGRLFLVKYPSNHIFIIISDMEKQITWPLLNRYLPISGFEQLTTGNRHCTSYNGSQRRRLSECQNLHSGTIIAAVLTGQFKIRKPGPSSKVTESITQLWGRGHQSSTRQVILKDQTLRVTTSHGRYPRQVAIVRSRCGSIITSAPNYGFRDMPGFPVASWIAWRPVFMEIYCTAWRSRWSGLRYRQEP